MTKFVITRQGIKLVTQSTPANKVYTGGVGFALVATCTMLPYRGKERDRSNEVKNNPMRFVIPAAQTDPGS